MPNQKRNVAQYFIDSMLAHFVGQVVERGKAVARLSKSRVTRGVSSGTSRRMPPCCKEPHSS
jgi:hypothetical protein